MSQPVIISTNQLICKICGSLLFLAVALPITSGNAAGVSNVRDTLTIRLQMFRANKNAYIERNRNTNQVAEYVSREYQRLFSNYENSDALRRISNTDLKKLYEATINTALFNNRNSLYRREETTIFAELERRRITSPQEIQWMYAALVASREFSEARRFALKYPKAGLSALPKMTHTGSFSAGMQTELVISMNKKEMTRQAVDIKEGIKIVVIATPLCHFAKHGLSAINADPQLRSIFENYAILLAPDFPPLAFGAYQKWNRQHPREQIGLAYLRSEWPMIDSWILPTFYFFKNGRLVTELSGWRSNPDPQYPNGGSLPAIKMALKETGLLHQP